MPQHTRLLFVLLLFCHATSSFSSSPAAASSASAAAATVPAHAPSFCKTGSGAAYQGADGPTTMSWAGNMLKVYHNLYHHNKKWYAVLDRSSNASRIDAGIAANTILVKLPTTDSKAFQESIKVCYVPGVTLYVDFPFPAFPDNLGHWAELLLPTYSVFSNPAWRRHLQGSHRYIDRVLLGNVRPELLYNWPKEMLALSLEPALPPWPVAAAPAAAAPSNEAASKAHNAAAAGVPAAAAAASEQQVQPERAAAASPKLKLPPGVVPWDRPVPQLLGDANMTGWCAQGWMLFENMVVVQDRFPILSMPDRQLLQPPQAAVARSVDKKPPEQKDDGIEVADSRTEAAAAETAAATTLDAADGQQGFWKTAYHVGFNRPGLAARFRAAAHARHLWGPPVQQQQQRQLHPSSDSSSSSSSDGAGSSSGSTRQQIPRVVTVLLYPEDYPPVVNHYALVDMLRNATEPYGFQVRTVSLTMGAPFLSHMATASDTGLLIARHGPLLASAMLLPPGAAVLELLPYKWEWRSVSSLYYNITQSTGQLHHWAWRPLDAKWCKYKEAPHARYAGWTTSECHGRECLLVHAQAGLEVDLEAVRQLIERKLPGLLAGESVQQLAEPWPPAD